MKIVTTSQYIALPPGSFPVYLHLCLVEKSARAKVLHALATNKLYHIQNSVMWEEMERVTYLITDEIPEDSRLEQFLLKPGEFQRDLSDTNARFKISNWKQKFTDDSVLNIFFQSMSEGIKTNPNLLATFYFYLGRRQLLSMNNTVQFKRFGAIEDPTPSIPNNFCYKDDPFIFTELGELMSNRFRDL